jgi:hypothetical protein
VRALWIFAIALMGDAIGGRNVLETALVVQLER